MLYLAEVRKQIRGFIGGTKTELKLLACQHNDQSWSAVPADEVVVCEDTNSWGEGSLVMLTLSHNRQPQGSPEQATPELIRQLQKISRLMEKVKDEQEKIEQWKQSLTYQSQELTRREMEIEARLEQVDQMESEFEYLERQRKELDESWERLHAEQQRFEEGQAQGPLSNLPPEQAGLLQSLFGRLVDSPDGIDSLNVSLSLSWESVKSQQSILDSYWQQLDQRKKSLNQRQQEVEQLKETFLVRQQELQSVKASLEEAKHQVKVQETVLNSKRELLGRLNLHIQATEDLRDTLTRLAKGIDDPELEQKIDLNALENMPLGELEEVIAKLQKELDKLVLFVNDQEEELTLQCQTVEELQAKLQNSSEYERLSLEAELAEEQECKGMLGETLFGQRRNLKERQAILLQYVRLLRRRKGNVDPEQESAKINLEPLVMQLSEQQQNLEAERQDLEAEIEHLQKSSQQLKDIIAQQWSEQQQKAVAIEQQQQQYQQANLESAKLQSQVQLHEETLQPIQDNLSTIRQSLETLFQWLK